MTQQDLQKQLQEAMDIKFTDIIRRTHMRNGDSIFQGGIKCTDIAQEYADEQMNDLLIWIVENKLSASHIDGKWWYKDDYYTRKELLEFFKQQQQPK